MPKKTFVIEWDWPDEEFWLPADSVALALHAYCKNTNFTVAEAAQQSVHADACHVCKGEGVISKDLFNLTCAVCGGTGKRR